MSYPTRKMQRLTNTATRLTQDLATATNATAIKRLTRRLQEVTAELESLPDPSLEPLTTLDKLEHTLGLPSAPNLSEKESAEEIINDFTKRDLAAFEQRLPTIGDTHSQELLTLDEIEARFDVLRDMPPPTSLEEIVARSKALRDDAQGLLPRTPDSLQPRQAGNTPTHQPQASTPSRAELREQNSQTRIDRRTTYLMGQLHVETQKSLQLMQDLLKNQQEKKELEANSKKTDSKSELENINKSIKHCEGVNTKISRALEISANRIERLSAQLEARRDAVAQGNNRQPNAEVQRRTVTCFQRFIQIISGLIKSIFSKTAPAATVVNAALLKQGATDLRSKNPNAGGAALNADGAALKDQETPTPGTTPRSR